MNTSEHSEARDGGPPETAAPAVGTAAQVRFPRLSVSLALGGTVLMLLGCLDPLEGVFLIVPCRAE